ncbi:MAG: thiolase family protein, partial [Pseudomonadota bacterium]|nr:thiolase family protein [Pseudomonadota bacterium]
MKNIVIAAYLRSPLTPAHKGSLKKVRADEMAAQVVKALLKQTKVKPEKIEDLIMGCAFPEGEQGFNVAKLVGFLAGLPQSTAAYTLNRFCGSSMQAIHNAAGMIQMGAGEAYICAGMENMSRTPMTGFNPLPHPGLYEKMPEAYIGMGETAENVVDKYKISREEMDEFATLSHQKAAKAQESGHFDDEIVPIKDGKNTISKDECIRPETTAEGLSGLKPAFKEGGSVTAGTSSPLTDGVCAVLICTEEFAEENNLKPLARIKSIAVAGCAPEIMGIGPVPAAKKALERAGITVDDLDVIELNEAFASQSLAVIRDLGLDIAKVN